MCYAIMAVVMCKFWLMLTMCSYTTSQENTITFFQDYVYSQLFTAYEINLDIFLAPRLYKITEIYR